MPGAVWAQFFLFLGFFLGWGCLFLFFLSNKSFSVEGEFVQNLVRDVLKANERADRFVAIGAGARDPKVVFAEVIIRFQGFDHDRVHLWEGLCLSDLSLFSLLHLFLGLVLFVEFLFFLGFSPGDLFLCLSLLLSGLFGFLEILCDLCSLGAGASQATDVRATVIR